MKITIPDEIYKNLTQELYDRKRIALYFRYLDAFVYKGIFYQRQK